MRNPFILGVGCRLDDGLARLAHGLDTAGDPFDMLLDGDRHVGQHRWALRTGNGEQVGETGNGDAQIGVRTIRPLLLQLPTAAASQVQRLQRAGHGVETGGKDDDIELVLPAPRREYPFP